MDERITEFESIALAARAKKGRMDAASRDKASTLLASIWADASVDPGPTLQLLEDVKAEAIAEAIRSCWPGMDNSRRNLFRKWVPAPSTEKSYRRLTFLVASVIELDGATAVYWLGLLVPPGRKNLSKESREILASILFGERILSFDTLVREGGSVAELVRICATLFDIAADPIFSVSALTRSRLGTAILGYLARPDAPKDSLTVSDLRSKIAGDAKKWPPSLRGNLISTPEATGDKGPSPPLVANATHAQPVKPAAQEPMLSTSAPRLVGPLKEELPRLEGELGNRISAMTRELDLLRQTHECMAKLVGAAEQVEAQREAANRELQRVQDLLRIAESERERSRMDCSRETNRASDLAAALDQEKLYAENERKRLAQQISANANGRIEEFKNRLGLTLSRLVIDLPGKETPVTAEVGKILLLQFHQFLDALRQEGIETFSGRVGSR
jgi:hypothetical protein